MSPVYLLKASVSCLCLAYVSLYLEPIEPLEARTLEAKTQPPQDLAVQRVRLTWWSDPSTTAAIGWDQAEGLSEFSYDERSSWGSTGAFRYQAEVRRPSGRGESSWVHLTGLKPSTAYQVRIKTAKGESAPLWFMTAPAEPSELSLIVGGDSRNHRKTRRLANQLVAQLTPTAVLFGGDFTAQNTRKQWRRWLDDWQLSISEDGRLTPLVPTRGNHDSERALSRAWGRAHPQFYYALSLGGSQLRIYTLNSERPAGGEQVKWLKADLSAHQNTALKIAQYHKPMRPHTGMKINGYDEYEHWAPLFTQHQLDLAVECDSHLMKVTWPLVMDPDGEQGFRRVSKGGTVFIGEGGWGAPLRSVSDPKPWTMKSARINHVFFIEIHPKGDYALKVLEVNAAQRDPHTPWRSFMWRRAPNQRSSATP